MTDQVRARVARGLHEAMSRCRPGLAIDHNGYVGDFRDVLLPMVLPEDFTDDLQNGDGKELQTKFRACHSSSALAVNCFAPFRRRRGDLTLPGGSAFDLLQFEFKCRTGLRGGRFPNLDLVLSGNSGIVGIESKLTEVLSRKRAAFSPAYDAQIRGQRREQGYFREMMRLAEAPDSYVWLDAAQLIKHAFGLAHTFPDRPVTLLYLYWEPSNPDAAPEFAEHRREIEMFAGHVVGSSPGFSAMRYPDLWALWRSEGPEWLRQHAEDLEARYLIAI